MHGINKNLTKAAARKKSEKPRTRFEARYQNLHIASNPASVQSVMVVAMSIPELLGPL